MFSLTFNKNKQSVILSGEKGESSQNEKEIIVPELITQQQKDNTLHYIEQKLDEIRRNVQVGNENIENAFTHIEYLYGINMDTLIGNINSQYEKNLHFISQKFQEREEFIKEADKIEKEALKQEISEYKKKEEEYKKRIDEYKEKEDGYKKREEEYKKRLKRLNEYKKREDENKINSLNNINAKKIIEEVLTEYLRVSNDDTVKEYMEGVKNILMITFITFELSGLFGPKANPTNKDLIIEGNKVIFVDRRPRFYGVQYSDDKLKGYLRELQQKTRALLY